MRMPPTYLAQLAAPQDYTKLMKGIDPEAVMFRSFANGPRGLGMVEPRWDWSEITTLSQGE
jgi:hypothetical protein